MEQEFKPVQEPVAAPKQQEIKIDPSAIKQEYAQMSEQQPQQAGPTDEQLQANRKAREEFLASELQFLRDNAEYTRLQVELIRNEFLLNQVQPNQVPGTLGRQLEIEQLESQLHWAELKMQQNEMMKRAQEEKKIAERKQEQEKDKSRDVTVTFNKEWIVPGSGGLVTIPEGKDYIITNAEDIKVKIPAPSTAADEYGSTHEVRSFSIHKLEDEGIVRILR